MDNIILILMLMILIVYKEYNIFNKEKNKHFIIIRNELIVKRNQILFIKKETDETKYIIQISLIEREHLLYFENINERDKEYENIINQL